jgi:dihydroneopterin aldolase
VSSVASQLARDGVRKQLYATIDKAIKQHVAEENCEFLEGAAQVITDRVYQYLVDQIEGCETNCRLHHIAVHASKTT